MEKKGISAIVITYNEESSIDRCLATLCNIADEIIVVDSFSSDTTEDICRKYNAIFVQHEFEGYVEQKNYALSMAAYPYVLSLDGDEALSEELKRSILKIKDNPDSDGYYFNRLNNFCGKWMRYSKWYPDRHLRLFNASKGRWVGPNPHDRFMLDPGSITKKINGDLLHWTCNSVEEFYVKSDKFSDISAKAYFNEGKKASLFSPSVHSLWRFFLTYILHLGFLDGRAGWIVCLYGAKSSYRKYSTLRMLRKNEENQKHE